jgi:hypothetical protein
VVLDGARTGFSRRSSPLPSAHARDTPVRELRVSRESMGKVDERVTEFVCCVSVLYGTAPYVIPQSEGRD